MHSTKEPPYYHILPRELHQPADRLIGYLTYFPFERPGSCYYCGSHKFHVAHQRKDGVKTYRCDSCKKTFNQFNGTVFARCWYPEKWGKFAYLMFCGHSFFEISRQLGFSIHATVIRNEKLLAYMKEEYPMLYEWRLVSQNKGSMPEPEHIKEQKEILKTWFDQRLDPQMFDCPRCGKTSQKKNAKSYIFNCPSCKKLFTAFTGTPFHDKPKESRHLWLKYSEYLCDGLIHYDIAKRLNISPDSSCEWKDVFFELMDQLGLDSLKYWAQWQHDLSRRGYLVAIHNKRLGKT